jgi:uncharacterized protein YdcH (DUF465 family)
MKQMPHVENSPAINFTLVSHLTNCKEEDRMATMARNPRDLVLESNAVYRQLAAQHEKYELELHKISTSPYLNSEDLLEEIRLKKLKLAVKDEMNQLAQRLKSNGTPHSQ